MSDALCGPSNALQNFQKHASVDRTLQQDRLISRQSPSQGFRSQNHSEGILDPEFAAFESNSFTAAPLPDVQHAGHFAAPAPHMPMSHPAEASNWATDFQKLNISGPSQLIHQQHGPSVTPMSAAAQSGWHDEFVRQQRPQQHAPVQQRQFLNNVQGFQSPFAPGYAMSGAQIGAFAPTQGTTNQSATEAFDESAFEAAFEQAKADMASQEIEASQVELQIGDSEVKLDKDHSEEATTQQAPPETIRIGSDTIPQSNKDSPQSAINDGDELARTAGQLLNSVSHDSSQKFQQSTFLALMRRIRDREVHVEGDEFRESAQSLHPGGKYYPEGSRQHEDQAKRSWRPIGQNDYVHVTYSEKNNGPSEELFVPRELGHDRRHRGDDKRNATSTEGSTDNIGPGDDNSLYASWNYGDRWA